MTTSTNPTDRMLEFFDSEEAEEYATKAQLRYAPVMAGNNHQAVAEKLREMVAELYELFGPQNGYPITSDVPDLATVDWDQLADHVIIDRDRGRNQ